MTEKQNARKQAQRRARQRKQRNRRIALTLCLMLAVMVASIGGTLAWLKDSTEAVTNTFTASNIDIELAESDDLDLKMVPGKTITKDPAVTVKAGSEASWLFVKIVKSDNYNDFLEEYEIADGWTKLDGVEEAVYYRAVPATIKNGVDGEGNAVDSAITYGVLKGNQVVVLNTVTKDQMDGIKNNTISAPTLTFTAYAIQKEGFETAAAAWTEINKPDAGN